MDFLIDNYLWFIIGGIVIIMIIIGYFAEKTNFGKKPLREKNAKEENKEVVVETPAEEINISEIENKGINDILGQSTEEELTSDVNLDDFENDSDILEETVVEETPAEEITNEELPEEDLNVPFGDAEVKPIEENIETPEVPEIIEEEQEPEEDDVWKF